MRPAWRGLKRRPHDPVTGRVVHVDPVVCGRKFCPACGRWRHVADYGYNEGRGIRSRCRCCARLWAREAYQRRTREQIERRREYDRIWADAQRRKAGIPVRNFHTRRSAVDRVEFVFLDRRKLVHALEARLGEWNEIAKRAGVPLRSLTRLRNDGGAYVRLDTADKLALALGTTLSLIYGDDYDKPSADLTECPLCGQVMPKRSVPLHTHTQHREAVAA